MAGSTFQPPINLDPSQDNPQQLSFINQNFQALASTLEAYGFRIVQSGTINVSQTTISTTAGLYGDVNVNVGSAAHDLGYKPACIGFLEFTTGARVALPYTLQQQAIGGTVATWQSYNLAVSSTRVFINLRGLAYNGSFSTLTATVRYYLLQEPAD